MSDPITVQEALEYEGNQVLLKIATMEATHTFQTKEVTAHVGTLNALIKWYT